MADDYQHWIGRSIVREDVVTARLMAEYRATLDPYLFDDGGPACPPGLHACLAPAIPAMAGTGPDGAERKGLFLPPIALPRRMWAGGMIETLDGIGDKRKVLIHINNTNPILDETSPERQTLAAAGIEVAHDGMDIEL